MSIKERNFAHIVEFDEAQRTVSLYRQFDNNDSAIMFTRAELPETTYDEDPGKFKEFALSLGESLLFDSPIARRIFGL